MNQPVHWTRRLSDGDKLSLERALDTLVSLGLTQIDAQVYVFLAKRGPHNEKDLADALKLTKHQLCRSLENLETKGMVSATLERAARFTAVPLEKVIDLFVKAATEQAKALQASRKELLSTWRSAIKQDSSNS
jgi:sugar-specific transcriptional regulator TrmB